MPQFTWREFTDGRYAMGINAPFFTAMLKDVGFDWDLAIMPHPIGVPAGIAPGNGHQGTAITASAVEKDLAWRAAKWICGKENALATGNLTRYIDRENARTAKNGQYHHSGHPAQHSLVRHRVRRLAFLLHRRRSPP